MTQRVTIWCLEDPWLSKAKGFILPNHDTGRILPSKSQRNTTDPSVAVTDSSATEYNSADESLVCSTPLPPLKKLDGVEPISGPKTIKSILRSKFTFKTEALKGVIINEPSSAPAKDKTKKLFKLQTVHQLMCERTDHGTCDHAEFISTINMSQHLKVWVECLQDLTSQDHQNASFPPCIHCGGIDYLSNECLYYPISCGSPNHTTTDHYDIEWFKRCEARQAKKDEALKSTRAESSNANRSKTPTKSGCSRHMTGVKIYLHKYVEQPGRKVVFGDDSTSTTEGYGFIKYNGIVFTKFDEKRGTIFNSNKEIIMIPPRVRDVYALGIKDLSINHEKYTLAIVDEYSRYTWVYFLKKKSQAPETIMSFIKRVENQNDIKIKQLKNENGIEFRNSTLINFCDEKGISQNFSSPYTPEQNGVAERKNRTLIESARTMLSGSIFSKQYWIEAVATACYTQNKSTVVKSHLKTPYEIFRKRISNISYLHVFGCPVYIHNHKDHLGKFDKKKLMMVIFLDTHLSPRHSESSTLEDNKLKKPITSHLMKALRLSISQNLHLTTSTLLNQKDIHLMNIFILMNLLKGIKQTAMMCPS
ncbi:retrovirus-related pol polyprotein from transposon TNT 1-94 [Tanacetum coccineum]